MSTEYKATLRLPDTPFPMKADLAQREPATLERWKKMDLYKAILAKNKGKPAFRLHDGPPYANGAIHNGHMLNKILKDITIKYQSMSGRYVEYVPGWDCHGLPIEHQVDKELGDKKHTLSVLEKRAACAAYAKKWIQTQKEGFERLGINGDWDNPYLTLNPNYEAAIARVLAKFADRGGLVRGKKPVHWSWGAETALAEAEIEYEDHVSPSIYVKYPVLSGSPWSEPASSLIWTTTPWTMPASLAISVHPDLEYVLVMLQNRKGVEENVIMAQKLVDAVLKAADATLLSTSEPVLGAKLADMVSQHPYLADRKIPTLLGGHVTLEAGTGMVHTAPGHGPDDFVIGQKYGLPALTPVNGKGIFTAEAGKYEGLHIFKANPVIVADLDAADRLLNKPTDTLSHSYPFCWRTHTPVIFRATPQWFITMEGNGLRGKALSEIDKVEWIPAWGRDRIYNMVAGRPDWCISRQRSWGVPIPVFHCAKCEEAFVSGDAIRHVSELFAAHGADVWWAKSAAELLPAGSKCGKCGSSELKKENDILDVWFESGVSYEAVYPNQVQPADLYLEGSDQHRGWFHSSLLTSVATTDKAPYKSVLTHGFVVDGKGMKISKSKGNGIDPHKVIAQNGAEMIRLWVGAEDYREDVRVSDEIMKQLSDAYRKIRNTLRFLLGNLSDFTPAKAVKTLDPLDQYALHMTEVLSRRVRKAYAAYEYHQVYHALNEFCAVTLSSFYLDVLKDRLYVEAPDSQLRRSAQTALWHITHDLVRLMAPILSFTADEAYGFLPGATEQSVHLTDMPTDRPEWFNEALAAEFEQLAAVRSVALKALETERQKKVIGAPLEARVTLQVDAKTETLLKKYATPLAGYLIVSEAVIEGGSKETVAIVGKAHGEKCARCWAYKPEVNKAGKKHPLLCDRCEAVVEGLGL